jgi:hypothetical protein
MPLDTKTITLSDGVPRKYRLTWGAVERIAEATGIDILEVEKPGLLMRHLSQVIHAGLVDRDKLTAQQVGDLIAIEDAQRIFNEALAVKVENAPQNPPEARPEVNGLPSVEHGRSGGTTSD